MQQWFSSNYGIVVTPDEATQLIDSRSRGSFMTEINRVLAMKKQKPAI